MSEEVLLGFRPLEEAQKKAAPNGTAVPKRGASAGD